MKGLILKDFMGMRPQIKLLGAFVFIYGAVAFIQKNTSMLEGMIVVLSLMMVINSFSNDSAYQWDHYILSAPVGRKSLVYSRYLYGLILMVVSTLVILLAKLVVVTISGMEFGSLVSSALIFSIAMVALAVMIPLMYKFGPEKSRLVLALLFVVPMLLVFLFQDQSQSIIGSVNKVLESAAIYGPVATLLLYILSSQVSIAVFSKKEI